ncbi:MAG: hypothetical protein Q8O30_05490 [Candidatus Omnitrophota bacterium]|nr:hypothetical protein [Candidatus Omnitrophota bacterium]
MIFSTSLKKSIFISLLGHLTLFSIFSFSFGSKIPQGNYAGVSFWGAILRGSDLFSRQNFKSQDIKEIFMIKSNAALLNNIKGNYFSSISGYYLKPMAILSFNEEKAIYMPKTTPVSFPLLKRPQAIMFYPTLPYHFLLYFKDRQVAHIELMFNIISTPKTNSIAVKRKISSGNLEADLLAMRYISHYLFIQQSGFSTDNWQTVKIELSPKDDKH